MNILDDGFLEKMKNQSLSVQTLMHLAISVDSYTSHRSSINMKTSNVHLAISVDSYISHCINMKTNDVHLATSVDNYI